MKLESELIPRPVKILDIRQESHDTFTFTLDKQISHKPGQFFQIGVLGVGEAPISISSYSTEHVKISVRVIGNVTETLKKLKAGDIIHIRGPYGNGYPLQEHKGKHLILIGGGCGVAPLKGAIDYLEQHHQDYGYINLFLGFRSPDDIIFQKELKQWEKTYHVTVMVDTAPAESCYTGPVGFVTEGLEQFDLPDPKNTIALMCGPSPMMKRSIEILTGKGIASSQIFLSAERLMCCAIGNCCHCMIRGKFVCTDGPVFCYEEIAQYTND